MVATEFNKIFSGGQLCEGVKFLRHFKGLAPSPSSGCCWRLGKTRNKSFVLPNRQQYPEDGDGVSPWNDEELSTLDAAVCPEKVLLKICVIDSFLFLLSSWMEAWSGVVATSLTVPGSIPSGVTRFFIDIFPSDSTMALGSTQPLVKMSTRNISWE